MRRRILEFMPRLRHPGYFFLVTAVLWLAVGANLVVFTAVNALWLKPLPFREVDRLITFPRFFVVDFEGPWRQPFGDAVAGQVIPSPELLPKVEFDGVGRDLEALGVTPGYFKLLGVRVAGRDFTPDDDRTGAEPVAVISHRLWSRDLGGRHDVIGSVVASRPVPIRVIGVAPVGFEGARRGERADIWIPVSLARRAARAEVDWSGVPMMIFARLPNGQSAAQIERYLQDTMDERLKPLLSIVPLRDVFGMPESPTRVVREGKAAGIVAGLALLVLAGGCSTVAGLMLVHYERRRTELALRAALGASPTQLLRLLGSELLPVITIGAVGALLLAMGGLALLPRLTLPGGVDLGRLSLSIDWRVVLAAIFLTVVTVLLAACLPILRATRNRVASDLFAAPTSTATTTSHRLRQSLLSLMVCAAIVVLVTAGLFVQAVFHGFAGAPGFASQETLFVRAQTASPWVDNGPDVSRMAAERSIRILSLLRSLPEVDEVAYGPSPIHWEEREFPFRTTVIEVNRRRHELVLGRLNGDPNILSALGVPLVAGRQLTASDRYARPVPAIVTASVAELLWPGQNPLGQVMGTSWRGGSHVVVGVSSNFAFGSLSRPVAGVVLTPARDMGFYGLEPRFILRTQHPEAIRDTVRRTILSAMPEVTWVRVATGRELLERDLGRQRLGAWFFSGFGLVALLLAIGGVFGLVAYLAESRRREFGIRVAMGAGSSDIVRHALAAALKPVSAGVAAGLIVAAWLSRYFAALLVGVSALAPWTYLWVTGIMLGCSVVAATIAAWRLTRITTADALRST